MLEHDKVSPTDICPGGSKLKTKPGSTSNSDRHTFIVGDRQANFSCVGYLYLDLNHLTPKYIGFIFLSLSCIKIYMQEMWNPSVKNVKAFVNGQDGFNDSFRVPMHIFTGETLTIYCSNTYNWQNTVNMMYALWLTEFRWSPSASRWCWCIYSSWLCRTHWSVSPFSLYVFPTSKS